MYACQPWILTCMKSRHLAIGYTMSRNGNSVKQVHFIGSRLRKPARRHAGFTLVELLVVIAIIGYWSRCYCPQSGGP